MGKKLFRILPVVLVLVLCACAYPPLPGINAPLPTEQTPTTEATTEPPTVATTAPPATTIPETEATLPAHSALYLPEYTPQQILEYFEEVVLHVEYPGEGGNPALVQKWTDPIYCRIQGEPTEEDLAVLNDFFAQLNEVPGFPGIYAATEQDPVNLTIGFWEQETFDAEFFDMLQGDYATGATQFWYYTDTNDIYTARIGYRTDISQAERNSILIEEIVNTLGITDTVLRTDSIVYQYSDENLALSDVDWIILKLLYDPAIRCGMDFDSCSRIIPELYY